MYLIIGKLKQAPSNKFNDTLASVIKNIFLMFLFSFYSIWTELNAKLILFYHIDYTYQHKQ